MIKTRCYTQASGFVMIKQMESMSFCMCSFPHELRRGQATLSFILLVSGVIMEIAIAGSVIAFFLSGSGLGERLSARALDVAQTGVQDAEVRIARNKEYCTTCTAGTPYQYSFTVGADSVALSIFRTDDVVNNVYVYTITSVATASNRQRKLVAVISADKTTGIVQFQSLTEQSVK